MVYANFNEPCLSILFAKHDLNVKMTFSHCILVNGDKDESTIFKITNSGMRFQKCKQSAEHLQWF